MLPIDLIEAYAYGTSKEDLVSEKEEIKCNNIIKWYKMINFDVTKETIKEHNLNCPQIKDHPCKTLIIRDSGFRKTNSLFNLIINQPDIHKTCLFAEDQYEVKYQLLIIKREHTGLEHFIRDEKLQDDIDKEAAKISALSSGKVNK